MKKSICIIGAGASGICAARHFATDFQVSKVVIYEQTKNIGGTWVLDYDISKRYSSVYEGLITNLPKEIMAFPDFPFPKKIPNSFVRQDEVREYLENYAEPIKHLIKFKTRVVKIERTITNIWKVFSECDGYLMTNIFDAIFICNGHFTMPHLPNFHNKYERKWIHSRDYLKAEDYRDQIVAVVGAGFSGIDIVSQLRERAKKVYLLSKKHSESQNSLENLPLNCVEKPALVDVDSDGLILSNGEYITNIDTIIYCTGYKYSAPIILDRENKNILKEVVLPDDTTFITPLFWDLAHANYLDSIFFIGLTDTVIPFLLFDHQVKLAQALMHNRIRKEILDLNPEQWDIEWLKSNHEKLKMLRHLEVNQWKYYENIRKLINSELKFLNKENEGNLMKEIPNYIRKIYDHVDKQRKKKPNKLQIF